MTPKLKINKEKKGFELVSIYHRIENVLWQCNVYRQQPERTEIFILSGLSLSRPGGYKTDFIWTTNIIATLSSISSAKNPPANVIKISAVILYLARDKPDSNKPEKIKWSRFFLAVANEQCVTIKELRRARLQCKSVLNKYSRGLKFSWHPNFDLLL